MKVLVLCGGYGTRLVRDIVSDPSQQYKHLVNVPKALLPIGDYPLLTHWVKAFQKLSEVEHIFIEVRSIYKIFLVIYRTRFVINLNLFACCTDFFLFL